MERNHTGRHTEGRTRADEEIIESGSEMPKELLDESAASIAASRRHARDGDSADAHTGEDERARDMDKPARRDD